MTEQNIISYNSDIFSGKGVFNFVTKKSTNDYKAWWPTDTKELFKSNCKKYPSNKSLQQYLLAPISYELNKHYFRTYSDIDSSKYGNVYLGCSHTFGVGHYLENTWGHIVNNEIGGEFWNFGVPGGSIQTSYVLLSHYVGKIKIRNVFIYLPHAYRYLQYNIYKDYVNINVRTLENDNGVPLTNESKINYLSEEYAFLINSGYLNAIENICRKYKINCYYTNLAPTDFDPDVVQKGENIEARDLLHFDKRTHYKVSSYMLDMLKNNEFLDASKYTFRNI